MRVVTRKAVAIACAALVFTALGCTSLAMPQRMPDDFNFVLRFGIEAGMGSKNVLDTFKGTFTKDLVMAGSVTTKLRLTNKEMQAIYEKMRDVEVWRYPEQYSPP